MITARRTRLEPEAAEAQTAGSCNRAFFKYLRTDYQSLLKAKKKRLRTHSEEPEPLNPYKRARTASTGDSEGGDAARDPI